MTKKAKKESSSIGPAKAATNAKAAKTPSTDVSAKESLDTTEIDDMFAGLKSKKAEKEVEEEQKKAEEIAAKKRKRQQEKEEEEINHTYGIISSNLAPKSIINPEAPVERVDPGTGYRVYKAHLLKVGEGGGTPLCPFDCDCCF
jgi:hypothetical protein